MKEALFVITVMLLCGYPGLAAQDTAGTVERKSGIIEINGNPESYLLEGRGVPCIVVGTGFIYAQFFSDNLKQHIQFVVVGARNTWTAADSVDLSDVTMATLVDEIDAVRQAFGHEKVCVVGHSVLGFWPLEYALAYPDHISHAVVIGTPPFHTAEYEAIRDEFIRTDASQERLAIWEATWQRYSDEVLEALPKADRFFWAYIRFAPMFWHDPTYDPFHHFAGRQHWSAIAERVFGVVIANYDPRDRFEQVDAPVFLALGRYDYSVPYVMWEEERHRLPALTYHLFEKSGHFPMLEEHALFDEKLIEFMERWKP